MKSEILYISEIDQTSDRITANEISKPDTRISDMSLSRKFYCES